MIKLENISKSYGDSAVLSDFSLSLSRGERICIVGASGCGKTTLLHVIAGLTKADSGKITKGGESALMFQEPRLLPWRNARENITVVLPKDKHSSEYELADKYLLAVGLSEDAEKMPDSLSGGMAQRVAFARFLAFADASDSGILLLDEPFSALDGDTADEMIALLDSFAEGKALILVTHDQAHAERLGAKIVKL